MKKPELNEFGLTDFDLNKYEKQKKDHEQKCEDLKKALKEKYKKYRNICAILAVSTPIIMAFIANNNEDSSFPFVLSLLFVIGLLGAFYFGTKELPSFSENEIGVVDQELKQNVEKWKDANKKYEEYLQQKKKSYWESLSGYDFEKEIATLYNKLGYTATVTPGSGDGGIDIILNKDNLKIAVQCKHHARPVGPESVRALQGVVAAQGYDSGVFVSLNGFTTTVPYEIRESKILIELITLKDILQMVEAAESENDFYFGRQNESKEKFCFQIKPLQEYGEQTKNIQHKHVFVGDKVKIFELDTKTYFTFILVETVKNVDEIAKNTPLGEAVYLHKEGDIVEVKAPEEYSVQIVKIYKHSK